MMAQRKKWKDKHNKQNQVSDSNIITGNLILIVNNNNDNIWSNEE